jgi:radical SAM protein with 4Fe4S-binding SPASM domain
MGQNLKIISWNITNLCNLRCTHCYLPARENNNSSSIDTPDELSTHEAFRLIDHIALVNSEAMLILSGGEPLLREDIFDLAAYASGKGMMVVLGSNGILINNRVARMLKEKGVSGVSISLDSLNSAIHDRMRSREGAWESAVKAIRICRDNGLAVQINTVVTRENYTEIPDMALYAQTLGAKVFSPFFLVCTGRGEGITDITPQQYEHILSFIVKSQGQYNGMMMRPRCAPTFRRILYQGNSQSPLLKMDTGRCMAGIHYCRITPSGNVTPCPYLPLSAGNVLEENFKGLWENSEKFNTLRKPSLKGKCMQCEFRSICGGCRARAFAYHKDYMGEDPWCFYTPKRGERIETPSFDTDRSQPCPGAPGNPLWTEEAEKRLKRVPFFVRSMVRSAVERYAIDNRHAKITPDIMQEARQKLTMGKAAGH